MLICGICGGRIALPFGKAASRGSFTTQTEKLLRRRLSFLIHSLDASITNGLKKESTRLGAFSVCFVDNSIQISNFDFTPRDFEITLQTIYLIQND